MAIFPMSGVLRGFPRSCPADIWRGDVLQVRLPLTAEQAGENPCLSRHSPFLRATADAALRLRQGFAARVLIEKISHL